MNLPVWWMVINLAHGAVVIPMAYQDKQACVDAASKGDVWYYFCVPTDMLPTPKGKLQ